MSTRSITVIKDDDGAEILVMYRQSDGYPSGHGAKLAEWLTGMQVCNGISVGQSTGKWANGMGCLAAQMVAQFKDGIGGVYLYPAGTRDIGEEYRYTIEGGPGRAIVLNVADDDGKVLWSGVPSRFATWLEELEVQR